jgi:hypothetical protein
MRSTLLLTLLVTSLTSLAAVIPTEAAVEADHPPVQDGKLNKRSSTYTVNTFSDTTCWKNTGTSILETGGNYHLLKKPGCARIVAGTHPLSCTLGSTSQVIPPNQEKYWSPLSSERTYFSRIELFL